MFPGSSARQQHDQAAIGMYNSNYSYITNAWLSGLVLHMIVAREMRTAHATA